MRNKLFLLVCKALAMFFQFLLISSCVKMDNFQGLANILFCQQSGS